MKKEINPGLVQVYTGSGKGKTTAALGLALRAIGHGFRVCMIQFLKGSSYAGELFSTQRLKPEFDFFQFGRGCPYSSLIRHGLLNCNGCLECFYRGEEEKREEMKGYVDMAWDLTLEMVSDQNHQLIILDEIGNALRHELLESSKLLKLMDEKPAGMELVLTGRGLPEEVLEAADLVSEIKAIKHPLEKGINSRRGIEY